LHAFGHLRHPVVLLGPAHVGGDGDVQDAVDFAGLDGLAAAVAAGDVHVRIFRSVGPLGPRSLSLAHADIVRARCDSERGYRQSVPPWRPSNSSNSHDAPMASSSFRKAIAPRSRKNSSLLPASTQIVRSDRRPSAW